MFRQNVSSQFNKNNVNNYKLANNKSENKKKNIPVKFSNLPTPISIRPPSLVLPKPSKEKLTKSKFYKKKKGKSTSQQSYVQASSANIKEILKIKEYFSKLLDKKVEKVHKTIINASNSKLQINTTTKSLLHKQICYELKSLEWNKKTNSCIRVNIRELDRELFTK